MMSCKFKLYWIALSLLCVFPAIYAYAYSYIDATNLVNNLTSGYENRVRPDGMTNISISFGLMSIGEVNTVSQEFATMGVLIAEWSDTRLTWNSSDYGGAYGTLIPASNIWVPPLLVNNAADSIRIINDDDSLASLYCYVHEYGSVKWLAPVNIVTSCDINIAKYPFDDQTCELIVSSWMFADREIFFTNSINYINLDLYSVNGEWEITDTKASTLTRTIMGFPMSAVSFEVSIHRKYSYYVMNMILPVVLLAFLGPFVFLLQMESGEQNGYALTVLLSLSVVMAAVSQSIPPTANHVCILSVYLLTTYILCTLETMIVVIMTRIHNYTDRGYIPSGRTQAIVDLIAKATFYRRADEEKKDNRVGSAVTIVEIVDGDLEKPKKAEMHSQEARHYEFHECAYIINFFNFVLFSIVNSLTILIFMFTLRF